MMATQALKQPGQDEPGFVIESGIPLGSNPGGGRKYPFNEMGVGDSFFVPTKGGEARPAAVRAAAFSYGKYRSIKLATRTVPGGIRIWRTA